jgi:plastocyanin
LLRCEHSEFSEKPTGAEAPLPYGITSYTYKFASTGTFGFYCTYHQSEGMTGKITVT